MQLVFIAHVGPQLITHRHNRLRIDARRAVTQILRHGLAERDGARAPCGSIFGVEEAVRHRIDELVRELRRHRRVDRDAAYLTGIDCAQHIVEAIDIHGLRKRVAHHLAHQRMIRNLDIADHRLRAR